MELQSARRDSEKELDRLLLECGTDSLEGAERRSRERKQSQEEEKTADTEARTLLGEENLADLRTQLAQLGAGVAELEAKFEDTDALDEVAAKADVGQAKVEHVRLLALSQEAQAAFDRLSEPFGRDSERLQQAETLLEEARATARNGSAALQEAREKASDASLDEAFAKAEAELGAAQSLLAEEQRKLDAYDGESIRTLATNSRSAAESAQRELNDACQVYAGVRSLVEAGREKGLFERARNAQDRALASAERLARVEARAHGVRRLLDVLTACRKDAYEKHRAPFRERVEKLSRLAFGKEVRIDLADDLTVARRVMDGITLDFQQLSGGAQEQLGLASRLATAMLLGNEGGPLLLDDTLGHSDPERLRGVGAMIGAAAQEAQVVIFTCQPDRFAHVGGARIVRL